MKNIKEISPREAFAQAKKGAVLVDVRERREVETKAFDIAGLMVVPFSRFEELYKEIPADRKVVVLCRSGNRSGMAVSMLQGKGYRKVFNMTGGIVLWEREGLPVKRKQSLGILGRLLQKIGIRG